MRAEFKNPILLTIILIAPIQNLRLEEPPQRVLQRAALKHIQADIHHLIRLPRLRAARKTLHLALQGPAEDLLNDGVMAVSYVCGLWRPRRSPISELAVPDQFEAGVVAGVDDIA